MPTSQNVEFPAHLRRFAFGVPPLSAASGLGLAKVSPTIEKAVGDLAQRPGARIWQTTHRQAAVLMCDNRCQLDDGLPGGVETATRMSAILTRPTGLIGVIHLSR